MQLRQRTIDVELSPGTTAKEAGKFSILTGRVYIQKWASLSKEEGEKDIGRPQSVSASGGRKGR